MEWFVKHFGIARDVIRKIAFLYPILRNKDIIKVQFDFDS